MTRARFAKTLSANDVGTTGSHQAGIHVPKSDKDLLSFFPALDSSLKNPDAWIVCTDDEGVVWQLRYIYYNNRLHSARGTRNEYRLTHLRPFMKQVGARPGDQIVFTATSKHGYYRLSVSRLADQTDETTVIKLAGWRRVH